MGGTPWTPKGGHLPPPLEILAGGRELLWSQSFYPNFLWIQLLCKSAINLDMVVCSIMPWIQGKVWPCPLPYRFQRGRRPLELPLLMGIPSGMKPLITKIIGYVWISWFAYGGPIDILKEAIHLPSWDSQRGGNTFNPIHFTPNYFLQTCGPC